MILENIDSPRIILIGGEGFKKLPNKSLHLTPNLNFYQSRLGGEGIIDWGVRG